MFRGLCCAVTVCKCCSFSVAVFKIIAVFYFSSLTSANTANNFCSTYRASVVAVLNFAITTIIISANTANIPIWPTYRACVVAVCYCAIIISANTANIITWPTYRASVVAVCYCAFIISANTANIITWPTYRASVVAVFYCAIPIISANTANNFCSTYRASVVAVFYFATINSTNTANMIETFKIWINNANIFYCTGIIITK